MAHLEDFRQRDDLRRTAHSRAFAKDLDKHPAGTVNLPPLLEARRVEFEIPYAVFQQQAIGINCVVMQLFSDRDGNFVVHEKPSDEASTGPQIVMPHSHTGALRRQSYTGILVAAGMQALDYLRGEGVELGHIVRFLRTTVFQNVAAELPHPDVEGKTLEWMAQDIVASDIRTSFDLADGLLSGRTAREIQSDGPHGRKHTFMDENGEVWVPTPTYTEAW